MNTRLKELFTLYIEGKASEDSKEELFRLVLLEENQSALKELVDGVLAEGKATEAIPDAVLDSILNIVTGTTLPRGTVSPRPAAERKTRAGRLVLLRRTWAAAAVAFLLILGTYWWLNREDRQEGASRTAATGSSRPEIEPGRNGAILTLADGSKVLLDDREKGLVATQNGAAAVLKEGQLAYDVTGKPAGGIAWNTITTPNGRQFSVVLADGSQVWLNAASSIRYPAAFTGNERQVEITGEAYFKIAKNTAMPFRVKLGGRGEIEVLGTEFNVNGYPEEKSLNTTLLEGAVRVSAAGDQRILKPGEQARINLPGTGNKKDGSGEKQAAISVVHTVNLEQITAWKNGAFNFEGMKLEEAMRQLSRWYDIEVEYENGIPDIRFGGELSRNMKLSNLLKALEKTGVHFRLENNRKLVVLPY